MDGNLLVAADTKRSDCVTGFTCKDGGEQEELVEVL